LATDTKNSKPIIDQACTQCRPFLLKGNEKPLEKKKNAWKREKCMEARESAS
jgi:hypothetical protein